MSKKFKNEFKIYADRKDVIADGETFEIRLDPLSIASDLVDYAPEQLISAMTPDLCTFSSWAEDMVESVRLNIGLHHLTDLLPDTCLVEELEERGKEIKKDIFAEDMTTDEFRLLMCDIFRVGNYTDKNDIFVMVSKKLLGETIV